MTHEEDKGKELTNEIFDKLLVQLKEKKDWQKTSSDTIGHTTLNISIHVDRDQWIGGNIYMENPTYIRAPFKHKGEIKRLARDILGYGENKKRQFVLDYFNGIYVGWIQFKMIGTDGSEERIAFDTWLKTDVTEENFEVVKDKWNNPTVYFKQEQDHAFMVLKWL